ncbi:MAG TPA: phosphoribosylanthranilate isomerase [Chthoniobacterales bacterium]
MHVKICGIRRSEDALLAAQCGADAVGLLVGQRHSSPDFVTAALAGEISRTLPPSVEAVLVTHITEVDEIERLLRQSRITAVQLHSEITADSVANLRTRFRDVKVFKSVHVISAESVRYPEGFIKIVDGFVLDTINVATDQVGGTGKVHDWSISQKIVERFPDIPIILAGGLNSKNVRSAIESVNPFGVDVNSGTKGSDGFKDARKMREFIIEAKRLDTTGR